MTDPGDRSDLDRMDLDEAGRLDDGEDWPGGVTEEYRDITDDDLLAVGTDQTTLGEASGGIDDLDDDLDEDLTPLSEKEDPAG